PRRALVSPRALRVLPAIGRVEVGRHRRAGDRVRIADVAPVDARPPEEPAPDRAGASDDGLGAVTPQLAELGQAAARRRRERGIDTGGQEVAPVVVREIDRIDASESSAASASGGVLRIKRFPGY